MIFLAAIYIALAVILAFSRVTFSVKTTSDSVPGWFVLCVMVVIHMMVTALVESFRTIVEAFR